MPMDENPELNEVLRETIWKGERGYTPVLL